MGYRISSARIRNCGQKQYCVFLFVVVVLIVLDVLFTYFRLLPHPQIERFCNMAREDGVGTFVAVIQFFLVAQTAFLLAIAAGNGPASRRRRIAWFGVSAFFCFLSFDDASLFHERVGSVISRIAQNSTSQAQSLSGVLDWYPSYAWQLSMGPLYILVGLSLLFFFWREAAHWPIQRLILIGFSCFGFAFILDFLEGIEGLDRSIARSLEVQTYTIRHLSKVVEESLELVGTSHFLFSFWQILAVRVHAVDIELSEGSATTK